MRFGWAAYVELAEERMYIVPVVAGSQLKTMLQSMSSEAPEMAQGYIAEKGACAFISDDIMIGARCLLAFILLRRALLHCFLLGCDVMNGTRSLFTVDLPLVVLWPSPQIDNHRETAQPYYICRIAYKQPPLSLP